MKAKIFTSMVLGIMLLAAPFSRAQNILFDGDFSSTTVINNYFSDPYPSNVWAAWQNWEIQANATIVDSVCNYQINTVGAGLNTWDIQLIQSGFPLIQNHSYRLSFDVKADANRKFGVYLGEDGGSWTDILGYDKYSQDATTDWKTITLDFNTSNVFDKHKVSFEIGAEKINMYFDNIVLQDLGPSFLSIGILGTSLNGWDDDVDLSTTDGIHYSLLNYPLTFGEAKFRQNNDWAINWGDSVFPNGFGYQNGPNIPISEGVYDITFNRESGEYSFLCVNNCPISVGILGSAVPPFNDWATDVNMTSNDGVNYILKNYTFIDGEAKFRLNDSWDTNWGNNTFPTGDSTHGGPNIPVIAGTYNVAFNVVTGLYSFTIPSIGILGSALIGWDDDIDMATLDGVHYTLTDYPFNAGEVKFREDNSWATNWGNFYFPNGFGYQEGPNIPVTAGKYDITFNRLTGEYNFSKTSCDIQCPNSIYIGSSSGICGAVVTYPEVTSTGKCGDSVTTITQTAGLPSGSVFPIGFTTNTFVLADESGIISTCSFDVYVWDAEPPVITTSSESIQPLWPANHKMVNIPINYSDNCGNVYGFIYYVWSNEPDNGLGDGDRAQDWKIVDEHNVLLRAERSGKGNGREYHIYLYCYDDYWNFTSKEIVVKVPHDNGKNPTSGATANVNQTNSSSINMNSSAENGSFKVLTWPNPSSQNFSLKVDSSSNEGVDVYISNISGRQISQFKVTNTNSIKFGDDFQPGVYFVRVVQADASQIIKIVKQ